MNSSDEQCSLSTQTCRVTKSTTSHFNGVGRGAPRMGWAEWGESKDSTPDLYLPANQNLPKTTERGTIVD